MTERKRKERVEAYGGPRYLTDIEKLVVSPRDDPISRRTVLLLLLLRRLVLPHGKQTARESRERRRDVVVLELAHPPALHRDLLGHGRGILDGLEELGRFCVQGMEVCDQLGIDLRERSRWHRVRRA